ncbi:MAG: hypothetical protein OEZ36_10050 [Spirochaetota bacterium]|nr:hypothetical protein [Spirochaetota bacterium]
MIYSTIDPSISRQCDVIENNIQCSNLAVHKVSIEGYMYFFCEYHFQDYLEKYHLST